MTTLTKKLKSEQQGKLLTPAKGVATNYNVAGSEVDRKVDAIWNMGMDPIAFYDCCLGTNEQESDYLSPLQQVKIMTELSKGKTQEGALGDAQEEAKSPESSQASGAQSAVSKVEPELAHGGNSVATANAAASVGVSAQQAQPAPVQVQSQPQIQAQAQVQAQPSVQVQSQPQVQTQPPVQAQPQPQVQTQAQVQVQSRPQNHVQLQAVEPAQSLAPASTPLQNANPSEVTYHSADFRDVLPLQSSGTIQLAVAQQTQLALTPVSSGTAQPVATNVAASQPQTNAPAQNQAATAQAATPNQNAAQKPSPFKASDEPKAERVVIKPLYSSNNPFQEPEEIIQLPLIPQLLTLEDFDKKYWYINEKEAQFFDDIFAEEEWHVEWESEEERLEDVVFDVVFDKPLEYGGVTLDPEFATYFFQHALYTYIPENRTDLEIRYFYIQESVEFQSYKEVWQKPLFVTRRVALDFMWQTPAYPGAKIIRDFANESAIYPLDYKNCDLDLIFEGVYDAQLHNHVSKEMLRSLNFCLNLEPLKKFAPQAREICEFFMKSGYAWLFDRQFRFWLYEDDVMRYFQFAPTVVRIYEKFRENGVEPAQAPTVDHVLSNLLYKWACFPLPFIEIPEYEILLDAVYRSVCSAGYLVRKILLGPPSAQEPLGGDEYWDLVTEDIHDYFSENRELGDLLYYANRPQKYPSSLYTNLAAAGREHYERVTGHPAPGLVFDGDVLYAYVRELLISQEKLYLEDDVLADLKERVEQGKLAQINEPAQSASPALKSQTPVSQTPEHVAFDQNYSTSRPDVSQNQQSDQSHDQSHVATPLFEHDGMNITDPSGFGLENFNVKLSRPIYDQLISRMSANLDQGNALDPTRDDTAVSAMANSGTQGYTQQPMRQPVQNQGGFNGNGQGMFQNQGMGQNPSQNSWQGQPQSGSYNQPQRPNQPNFNQQNPVRLAQGQRVMGNQGNGQPYVNQGQPRLQQNYNQQRQGNPQNYGQGQRQAYQNQGRPQGYNQAQGNNQYAGQGQMRPQGYNQNQNQNGMGRNMGGMSGQYPTQGSPMRGYANQMQGQGQNQGQGQMRPHPQQGSNNWGGQNNQGYNQGQQGYNRNPQARAPQGYNNQGQPNYNRGPQGSNAYANGAQNYNRGPQGNGNGQQYYNQGQQNYNSGTQAYNRGPQGSGSNAYANGPQNFNSGTQAYNRGPQGNGNGQQSYNQGQPNYNSGTQAYNRGPQSNGSGSNAYANGPQNYNRGSQGNGNGQQYYNQGQPNYNSGTQAYNRAPQGNGSGFNAYANGPQNFNSGTQAYNRGPQGNGNGGQSYNQGQPNYNSGTQAYNRGPQGNGSGSNAFANGPQNYNRGPQGNGNGGQSYNQCQPNYNSGTQAYNRGPQGNGSGSNAYANGPQNYNRDPQGNGNGQQYYNQGQPNYNSGTQAYNRGPQGSGSNAYANGPQNFNSGTQAYNRGPQGNGNGGQSYNQGQPNYNSGTQAFNRAPQVSGTQNFNSGTQAGNHAQLNNSQNSRLYSYEPEDLVSNDQVDDDYISYTDSGEIVYNYGPLDENGGILLDYLSPEQIDYNLGPQFYRNVRPQGFRQQNFNQGDFGNGNGQPQPQQPRFAQRPQNLNNSQGFNHGPQQFNQGQFGQGNGQPRPQQPQLNQAQPNFGTAPQSFNRYQQSFSNSQNGSRSGQPQPQYNQGQGNFRPGQPQGAFNQGQNGFGSRQPQPMYQNGQQRNGNWQQSQPQRQPRPQQQAQPQPRPQPRPQAQVSPQMQPQARVNQGQGAFTQGSGMGNRAQNMGVNSNFGLIQPNMEVQTAVSPSAPAASAMVAGKPVAGMPVAGTPVAGTPVSGGVAAPAGEQPQLAPAPAVAPAPAPELAPALDQNLAQQNSEPVDPAVAKELKKFRKTFGFDVALIELYKHAQRMGIPFEKQQSMYSMLSLLLETMFLKKLAVPELPPFEQLFSNVCVAVERAGRVPALRTKEPAKNGQDEPRYGLPFEFELDNLLERFKQNKVEVFRNCGFDAIKEAMPSYADRVEHLIEKTCLYRRYLEDRNAFLREGVKLEQLHPDSSVIDEEYDSSDEYRITKGRKIKRSREEQIKYDYYTRIAQLEKAYKGFYLDGFFNAMTIKDYATFRVRLDMREDLLLVFPDDEELYDLEFLGIKHDLKFLRQFELDGDQVKAYEAILAKAEQAKAERIAAREARAAAAARAAAEAEYQAEQHLQQSLRAAIASRDMAYSGAPSTVLMSGGQPAAFGAAAAQSPQAQATVLGDVSGMEAKAAAESRASNLRVQSGTKLLDASLEPSLAGDSLTIHSGTNVANAPHQAMPMPATLPPSAAQMFANMAQASSGATGASGVVSASGAAGAVGTAWASISGAQAAGALSGAQAMSGASGAGIEAAHAQAQATKTQKAAKAAKAKPVAPIVPVEPEIESIEAEIVGSAQLKAAQSQSAQSQSAQSQSAQSHSVQSHSAQSQSAQSQSAQKASAKAGSSFYADTLRNFKNRIRYPLFNFDFSAVAGTVRGSRVAVAMQGIETDFHVRPEERSEYDLGLQYATTLPDPRILLMEELKRIDEAQNPKKAKYGRKRRNKDDRDYVHPVIAFLKASVLSGAASGNISTYAITAAIAVVLGSRVTSEIQIAKVAEAVLRAHNIKPIDQTTLLAEPEKWAKYIQVDLDGEIENPEQLQKIRNLMQVLMQPSLPSLANDGTSADQANTPSLANGTEQVQEEPEPEYDPDDVSHLTSLRGAKISQSSLSRQAEVVIGWRNRLDPRFRFADGEFDPFGLANRPLAERIVIEEQFLAPLSEQAQPKPPKYYQVEAVDDDYDDEDMIIAGPSDWRMREPEGYRRSKVNVYKTFDNFVPSPENQTVLDTAKCIVEAPDSQIYSPFYVYSASGLGKTHLVMAIANALHDKHPDKRVTYIRAEDFIYNYVLTVKQRNSPEFRRYQDTDVFSSTLYTEILESDVVIVDDVQNFAKAQKSRDAFFEVVAAFLENPSHQLILASDVHPNELKKQGFNPRLTSRFAAGICYELVMPSVSSRRTIVCAKSSEIGIRFSENLVDYMANNLGTNIREIEGAVKSISSHILINGSVSLNKAVKLVGSYIPVPKEKDKIILPPPQIRNPHLSLPEVKRLVARAFSLSVSDLESSSRRKVLSTARAMAMLLAKELLHKVTLCEIGKSFNRDHSSVIEAMQRIRVRIDKDSDLQRLYEFLTDKLSNPSKDDGLNFQTSAQEQASASDGQDADSEDSNGEV